jgi:signal transduction histidine kinase/iron only hydrogenase large subunit-like protein
MMTGVIQTIKQNCRRCYCCVRECPAKAIRIVDGQASVVSHRCIGCGNCTVVCSQGAKAYTSGAPEVRELLASGQRCAALLAPSFPADALGAQPARLVGALRRLGFSHVVEVAHGADLVSLAYRAWLEEHPRGLRVATACPAVVEFVRKYNPSIVPCLIPIVSPMVATALAVQRLHGSDVRSVFIGPCIAKKAEARDPLLPPVVSGVLTFHELAQLFVEEQIEVGRADESPFDPPLAGLGRAYPLEGGLLKSAGLERNIINPEILVLSGMAETTEALERLQDNPDEPMLVEAMMCQGCYSGPGLSNRDLRHRRGRRTAEYVKAHLPPPGARAETRLEVPEPDRAAAPLDLARRFAVDDQRLGAPTEEQIRVVLAHTNKFTHEDELNCGACGYPTCRAKAAAVCHGLAEDGMCLPFMIEQAERVCHELNMPPNELRDIHRHLVNTEKLASMGQMAAGVAHELNNPLGTIILYTGVLERKLASRPDIDHDLKLLVAEAQRCKKIIGMLLEFARHNRVQLERTDLAELLEHAVDLTRFAVDAAAGTRVELAATAGLWAEVDRDQLVQVIVNLIKNGLEAMEGRGGAVRLKAEAADSGCVRILVSDEGRGIPPEARDKVFQPFFTTKSIGKGTGLGLPIAYGIVKMHRGTLWFDTEMGHGTTFTIQIPKTQSLARSLLHEPQPHPVVH